MDGPYGASFGSAKDLYNVFVRPFTDVVDTAVGKTKELSQKAQTLSKVAFEAMMTTLLPTLEDDFHEIFANEKENIAKLKAQYKDVYDATWTAFKDNDVVTAAFFYSPSSMITAKVAQQAPIATINVLNVLTGGKLDGFLSRVKKAFQLGDTKKPLDRDGPHFGADDAGGGGGSGGHGGWDTGGMPEGTIHELHKRKKPSLGSILSQKKIKQVINNNPKTAQMSDATRKIVDTSLKTVLQRANTIANAGSIDDIEKGLGTSLKGADDLRKLPDNERQALEQPMLKALKMSAQKLYTSGIQQQLQSAVKAGVPEDHPYVLMLGGVISKLKSMA